MTTKKTKEIKPLEFAKYYDVTDIAKKTGQYNDFYKVFICSDTHTFWIARIVLGVNSEYETKENGVIIEREDVDKDFKGDGIDSLAKLVKLLSDSDFDNYDVVDATDVKDAIEMLDNSFGICKIEFLRS